MYLDNKYTRWYYSIIENARNRKDLPAVYERHHVIPRSLGGSDLASNIVALTAREHFICHRLLVRMTTGGDKRRMTYAAWTMARTRNGLIKINSRVYEDLKSKASRYLSELLKGVKQGPMSEEHRRKISEATIRRYEDPMQRELTGASQRGRVISEESRAKMSKAAQERKERGYRPAPTYGMQGKKHSPETIARMKAAWDKRRLGV